MNYPTGNTLLIGMLLSLLCGLAPAQQCQQWQRVNTPSPGTVSNFFIDAEEANGTVYALMFSTDSSQVRPPGEYRVLRRDGATWTDLGGPDDEVLSDTEFEALGVAPDGETIYVGGFYFPSTVGQDPAPVMAVGDASGNWSVPMEIEIPPTVVEPVSRRAAQILSIEVAANGTAFATGGAQGFGGGALGIDGTVPLFLVNDGSGWVETGVEPGQDWPGGSGIGGPGTQLNDMHLFAADDVWLAGRHDDNGTTGGGLLLHWDGAALAIEEDPRQGGIFLLRDFFGIDGNAPTALHAVGGNDIEQQPVGTMALRDIDGWSLLSTQLPAMWLLPLTVLRGHRHYLARPRRLIMTVHSGHCARSCQPGTLPMVHRYGAWPRPQGLAHFGDSAFSTPTLGREKAMQSNAAG